MLCPGLLSTPIYPAQGGRPPSCLASNLYPGQTTPLDPQTDPTQRPPLFVGVGFTRSADPTRWKRLWSPARIPTRTAKTPSGCQKIQKTAQSCLILASLLLFSVFNVHPSRGSYDSSCLAICLWTLNSSCKRRLFPRRRHLGGFCVFGFVVRVAGSSLTCPLFLLPSLKPPPPLPPRFCGVVRRAGRSWASIHLLSPSRDRVEVVGPDGLMAIHRPL